MLAVPKLFPSQGCVFWGNYEHSSKSSLPMSWTQRAQQTHNLCLRPEVLQSAWTCWHPCSGCKGVAREARFYRSWVRLPCQPLFSASWLLPPAPNKPEHLAHEATHGSPGSKSLHTDRHSNTHCSALHKVLEFMLNKVNWTDESGHAAHDQAL